MDIVVYFVVKQTIYNNSHKEQLYLPRNVLGIKIRRLVFACYIL